MGVYKVVWVRSIIAILLQILQYAWYHYLVEKSNLSQAPNIPLMVPSNFYIEFDLSINASSPTPDVVTAPQTMTLPPPCFTMGNKFLSSIAEFFLLQILHRRSEQGKIQQTASIIITSNYLQPLRKVLNLCLIFRQTYTENLMGAATP